MRGSERPRSVRIIVEQEFSTNAFVFFQVLGPGMSPQGPA